MRGRLIAATLVAAAASGCSDDPFAPQPLEDLPADLAAITFTAEGRPSTPYVMLELRHTGGFSGFVAVDADARPVWYFRTQGTSSGFTRRANGNFVFLDVGRGLVEVSRSGSVVRELPQQERPGRRMHHDVTVTPRNTVLFLAEDWQPWEGALLAGEALWEWDPEAGTTTKRWSSFAHLDPASDWGARSVRHDWLHANSIRYGPRGNVLISFHFLNQVISISPTFDRIEWRMGGIGADVPVDDPFSGQHTAQELRPNRVLLFDNGYERLAERYSRAAEYELRDGRAAKVWEWRPPRDNWARIISGVRRLPNENSIATFGTSPGMGGGATGPIEVYEVTPGGDIVWHLVVSGDVTSLYRATPLPRF